MIYVREDVPSKLLTKGVDPSDIKCMFLELNFRKYKWLLEGTYNPPSQNNHYFFENLDKAIDVLVTMKKFYLQETLMQKISEIYLDSFIHQHEHKEKHVLKTFRILVALTNNALTFQHRNSLHRFIRFLYVSLDSFKNFYLKKQTKENLSQKL